MFGFALAPDNRQYTMSTQIRPDPSVTEALQRLGVDKLALAVHDASFPSTPGQDTGRGSPYSEGGRSFARFARSLGFNAMQLGPQGQTTRANPSPYDSTLFSKSFLSIDLHALAHDPSWSGLLSQETYARIVEANPHPDGRRVPYRHCFDTYDAALAEARTRLERKARAGDRGVGEIADRVTAFKRRHPWLEPDSLYEALRAEHGNRHWREWPQGGASELDQRLCVPPAGRQEAAAQRRRALHGRHGQRIRRYVLGQMIVHEQHAAWLEALHSWGLRAYADLQIGLSSRDTWRLQDRLMASYLLGAPPSRTNPDGQPWGHGVLDPDQYHTADGRPGPVLDFISQRIGKLLDEFDGLRIDHPHGLVCPWVYRADDPDAFHAVQHGARLFSSPDLPDHPELSRHAIVGAEQLDRSQARHADGRVRELTPDQVDRYATLIDTIIAEAQGHGREVDDILCEVLSTQPHPLARVMDRHGLGRFRVTQKAHVHDPNDVYRSENAAPADWIMVGNHDTPPIWRLARDWHGTETAREQAHYLAQRLRPAGATASLAERLAGDPRRLVHAKMADLFLSPARHVMIFFPDLLGMTAIYNVPGTVDDENWTLRVPPDFRGQYAARTLTGDALNMPAVLAAALGAAAPAETGLIRRLHEQAGSWRID